MTEKNPARTRTALLDAAFREIHARGFRAASLDHILRRAGVTKGALYHHFPSKRALGHAVVEELLAGRIRRFRDELVAAEDPLDAIRAWLLAPPWLPVRLGCPVNNLAQEMSASDEGFRARVEAVFSEWRAALADAVRAGQASGNVRGDVDAEAVGTFVLAALEGAVSLAKSARDEVLFQRAMGTLAEYVAGLRSDDGGGRRRRQGSRAGRSPRPVRPARRGSAPRTKGRPRRAA